MEGLHVAQKRQLRKIKNLVFDEWSLETAQVFRISILIIDLILIDQQSVGKRSLHQMDTVNAKKRWTTIYWRVNIFLKKSHIVTL
jgi:hypothetical protein